MNTAPNSNLHADDFEGWPLAELVERLCHGDLTATDAQQLETLVIANPAARRFYARYLNLHAHLPWVIGAAEDAAPAPIDSVPADRSRVFGFLADAVRVVPGGEFVVGGLVLLAVTVAVWGVIYFTRSNHPSVDPRMLAAASADLGVGSLAVDDRTHWAQESPMPADTVVRIGRRYELASGGAKIELTRGTTVAIEGPAIWQLDTDQRLELASGKLVAQVPQTGIGFTVVTPTAEVVDLGTEFGIDVDTAGNTDVHVLQGAVEVKPPAQEASSDIASQKVLAGDAVRISADGRKPSKIKLDRARFEQVRAANTHLNRTKPTDVAAGPFLKGQSIWLGNLFDDPTGTSLAEAMRTDAFRATADIGALGVERILHGGDSVKQIAPHIWFDAKNLGWEDFVLGEVSNDAWGVIEDSPTGGIRTRGTRIGPDEPKIEEGIGVILDALITFDLDEIRAAGGSQQGRRFEFVCDRAGIDDTCAGDERSSVQMVVLVSNARGVQTACGNGVPARVGETAGIWNVTSPIGKPLRADGRFAEFRVAIPADATYLTLLATSAGDGGFADHAVWSGARLEVQK